MKRILVITVLAVLLLSTVGATVAVAQQKGKSSVYQFDIAATDSHGSGKLMIDLKQRTFHFTGKGFVPGRTYWLWCEASGPRTLGSVVANPAGNVEITGMLPDNVNWATATGAAVFSAGLNLMITQNPKYANMWQVGVTVTWSGAVGAVSGKYTIEHNGVTIVDVNKPTATGSQTQPYPLGVSNFEKGSGVYIFTITLTDSAQHTATDSDFPNL